MYKQAMLLTFLPVIAGKSKTIILSELLQME